VDCSSFESDEPCDRYINWWRAELLQYHFTIWHHGAKWIVKCDFLSRYNMGWDTRREEHNTEQRAQAAKMAIGAPEATAQVSTAKLMKRPFSNTPILLVGPKNSTEVSKWAPLATLWEQNRQILTIDSIGCPLAEALNLTQLPSFHITELETDATKASLSATLQQEWPIQSLEAFLTNFANLSPTDQPKFQWLVAIYPKALPASGSKDPQLMDWYGRILATAATLKEPCNIQSVVIIGPLQIPDTARAFRAEGVFREACPGWKCTISAPRNTPHGGAIETQHQVIFSPAQN
jgi:hypothetical protein